MTEKCCGGINLDHIYHLHPSLSLFVLLEAIISEIEIVKLFGIFRMGELILKLPKCALQVKAKTCVDR